ncbi:TPA: hypothetical protein J1114_005126 [Escherichia coli]|nr:hypothetical protein [Escherichia coli]HBB8629992.1 hypothetical protein [Escherichia coli]
MSESPPGEVFIVISPKHTSDTDKEPASAVAPFSLYDVFTQSNNEQIQSMSDGKES